MEAKRSCIIYIADTGKDKPLLGEVVRVYYKDKYVDKYSQLIGKDKVYPMDEANELLKLNTPCGFILATRNDLNKGSDMIEELACLEERADLNFETLNWDLIDGYIKEIEGQGYSVERLSEKEFEEWSKWKYPEK